MLAMSILCIHILITIALMNDGKHEAERFVEIVFLQPWKRYLEALPPRIKIKINIYVQNATKTEL